VVTTTHAGARPAIERADELLREMTLEEKAMQVSCVTSLALYGIDGPLRGQLDSLLSQGIGHVAGIGMLGHKMPNEIATSVNARSRRSSTMRRSTASSRLASPRSRRRSASPRRGIPTASGRWPTSCGVSCGLSASSTPWRRSWTWRATPGGVG
jgi:hypothetical protein